MAKLGDRGQILLLGGLLLALTIIVLALVFNSAVFTSTQAGQAEQDVSVDSELALQEDVKRHVATLFRRAEAKYPGDRPAQRDYIKNNISTINSHFQQYAAGSERIVNISWNGTFADKRAHSRDFGWRVYQNQSVPVTNTSSTSPLVIGDQNRLRDFSMNVTDVPSGPVSLNMTFTGDEGAGDEYRVWINTNYTPFELHVTGPSSTDICESPVDPSSGDSVWINVTDATLAGERCNALDFFSHLESPYYITFENGTNTDANYSLITDDPIMSEGIGGSEEWYRDPSRSAPRSGETEFPRGAPHLYGVLIDIEYYGPDVDYNSTVAVAPGEPS